jgi:hypothetical protein
VFPQGDGEFLYAAGQVAGVARGDEFDAVVAESRHAEARQRLAEIYGWFTERFETKDVQEAKAVLEAPS